MKKFISIILCLVLLCCGTFIFVGCDKNGNKQGTQVIDLSTLSEGDEIPVYPNCEFNYKIKEDGKEYICHISSITAKFVKANKIEENDTVEGYFNPYEISVCATGYTDKSLANYTFTIQIASEEPSGSMIVDCIIDNNGFFKGEQSNEYFCKYVSRLKFSSAYAFSSI